MSDIFVLWTEVIRDQHGLETIVNQDKLLFLLYQFEKFFFNQCFWSLVYFLYEPRVRMAFRLILQISKGNIIVWFISCNRLYFLTFLPNVVKDYFSLVALIVRGKIINVRGGGVPRSGLVFNCTLGHVLLLYLSSCDLLPWHITFHEKKKKVQKKKMK